MHFLVFLIGFSTLLGGILRPLPISEEPENEANLTYAELVCTPEDREKIHYIITTVSENNWFALIKHKSDLTRKGNQIEHVHPLKFLAAIFSDPNIKECMRKISADGGMKYNRIVGDVSANLTNQMTLGQVEPHLEEFAKEVSVPVESIRSYVQARDWEGLIQLLLSH